MAFSNTNCCVPQCSSRRSKNPELSFHEFPTQERKKQLWSLILRIGKEISRSMLVCSKHFQERDYLPGAFTRKKKYLKKNAVPSNFLPEPDQEKECPPRKVQYTIKNALASSLSPVTNKLKSVEQLSNMNMSIDNIYCCAPSCKSSGKDFPRPSFYRFPSAYFAKDVTEKKFALRLLKEWIRVLRIGKRMSHDMVVCGKHFKSSDFIQTGNDIHIRVRLRRTAVPSLNLPPVPSDENTEKLLKLENAALKITLQRQKRRDAEKNHLLRIAVSSKLPSRKEQFYSYSCLNQSQVLESLEVAANAAKQCMNSRVQATLLLEILSHCIYFHEKSNAKVKNLIEELLSEIKNLLPNIGSIAETEKIDKLLQSTLQPIQDDIIKVVPVSDSIMLGDVGNRTVVGKNKLDLPS